MIGQTHWSRVGGLSLTLLSVAVVELLYHTKLHFPHAAIVFYLNVVVMYAAFSGKLSSGLISGTITSLYLLYHLSADGQQFGYTANLLGLTVTALASPTIALMVGIWKRYGQRALETAGLGAILHGEISKRGEEELRSEANCRSLVERAPFGICRARSDGKILMVNPALAEMLGYASKAELLAANLATDMYTNPGEWLRLAEQLGSQERFQGVEVEWRRRDGKAITVRLSGKLVQAEDGALPYFEAIAEDITERRALEEQLRHLEEQKTVGQLADGVAQDLDNLFIVITDHSQLLAECLNPADPLHETIQEIKSAADRAVSSTQQLSGLRGDEGVQLRLLDLSSVVAGMEGTLRRLIGADIELVMMLGTALGGVKADPGHMERIILNLAANARDAMPNGGKLIIKTANVDLDEEYARWHPSLAVGNYVMLAVSDTGCGMDAETRLHIFKPFFTTKERDSATGLGLATVYGVIQQSGGYIAVSSGPGHGATFKIYLPRVEAVVEAAGSVAGDLS